MFPIWHISIIRIWNTYVHQQLLASDESPLMRYHDSSGDVDSRNYFRTSCRGCKGVTVALASFAKILKYVLTYLVLNVVIILFRVSNVVIISFSFIRRLYQK